MISTAPAAIVMKRKCRVKNLQNSTLPGVSIFLVPCCTLWMDPLAPFLTTVFCGDEGTTECRG